MTWETVVAAAVGACMFLVVLTVCAAVVMRQLRDKPRPLEDVVTEQGIQLKQLDAALIELADTLKRGAWREKKRDQRATAAAAPEDDGPKNPFPAGASAPAAGAPAPPNIPPHLLAKQLMRRIA